MGLVEHAARKAAKQPRKHQGSIPGISATWKYEVRRCYNQFQCAGSEYGCNFSVPEAIFDFGRILEVKGQA